MTKKEVIVPADDLVCLGKDKLQELIRCKDCIWHIRRELTRTGEEDRRYRPSWCELMECETPEDGYCYKSLRKEE